MKKIAVVVSNIRIDPQKRVVESMIRYAVKNNIVLDIFTCSSSPENTTLHNKAENSIYRLPLYEEYEGVVLFANTLFPASFSNNIVEGFKEKKLPVVLIATRFEGVSSVGIDNHRAMKRMVNHFIKQHGFTKINYIGSNMHSKEARERHSGYIEALTENDIFVNNDRIYLGESGWNDSQKAMEKFMSTFEEFPEAIICGDDLLAITLCEFLSKHNIRIPEDIAISGFNGMYDAKNYSPKITTVEYPYEEIGELACFHIMYNDKNDFKNKDIVVDSIPIFTQSCGCRENKGVSYEEFKKTHFIEKAQNIRINTDTNRMSSDFTSISNLEDFSNIFKKYIKELECNELYLCLYDDWDNNEINTDINKIKCLKNKSIKEREIKKSTVLIAYHDGKDIEDQEEKEKAYQNKGKANIYFPINYQGKMFGYIVMCDYLFAIESAIFPGWIMNLGIALESVCRQRVMDAMVEKLNETYLIDQLTGLYNRMGFNKYSETILNECKSMEKNFCILFLDLDDLKSVNDMYGHDEGDNFLKTTSEILRKNLDDNAVIMRYGGDEFVAALCGCDSAKIKKIVNDIKREMHENTHKKNKKYKISASIGYFNNIPDKDSKIEDYISIADRSMYEEKKRSNICSWDIKEKITE